MPSCFLKRAIPFALTLLVGLVLGGFFRAAGPFSVARPLQVKVAAPSQAGVGYGDGIGTGEGSSGKYYNHPFLVPAEDGKAQILRRVEPQYTEEARRHLVEGTVVLRAVLSEDGSVRDIRPVSGLPYGLTERAVEAARGIEFFPAIKDGRPVAQYIQLEYNFRLY